MLYANGGRKSSYRLINLSGEKKKGGCMKNLKDMNYRELKLQRDLIVNAKAFSICDVDRRGFQQVIESLEDEIYRREMSTSRKVATPICVAVLLAIMFWSQGCQTVKGVSGDAGWILTKVSDNIVIEQDK